MPLFLSRALGTEPATEKNHLSLFRSLQTVVAEMIRALQTHGSYQTLTDSATSITYDCRLGQNAKLTRADASVPTINFTRLSNGMEGTLLVTGTGTTAALNSYTQNGSATNVLVGSFAAWATTANDVNIVRWTCDGTRVVIRLAGSIAV